MIAFLETTGESTMTWPLALLLLVAGVIGLLWGGQLLVEGAVSVARQLGMSTLLIGLTIVAFGTSAPELALNAVAAIGGETGLAFGNVIGSNIANIGLVLGLTAIVAPIRIARTILRKGGLPWLVVVTGVAIGLPWIGDGVDGQPGYTRWWGLVMLGLAPITAWLWFLDSRQGDPTPLVEEPDVETEQTRSTPLSWLFILAGLVLLIVGGKGTEIGAVQLARWMGLSEAVIGLSIVAVATSLPEVVTALIAARRGEPDLAIGTVVGSNLFNLALVLGTTAVICPITLPDTGGGFDLAIMGGMTLLLIPIAVTGRRIGTVEGLVLLLAWAGTIAFGILRETT
ncbi:MAG: calcium/sodium antiporter [Phycisphaerales bacterium]|nr:calcium/sodium antiporter [Phycisphaerales bacterium]